MLYLKSYYQILESYFRNSLRFATYTNTKFDKNETGIYGYTHLYTHIYIVLFF